MYNIMISEYNFGEQWFRGFLADKIQSNSKVSVIPFAFPEGDMEKYLYGKRDGKYFKIIEQQFNNIGVYSNNIEILDYYEDSIETMKSKLNQADIIFLTGGNPEQHVKRLQEKDLVQSIRIFNGIIIGASAGALIQPSKYFCTPDEDYPELKYFDGLGISNLNNNYIEVHYEKGNEVVDKCLKDIKFETNKNIFCIGSQGAVIYNRQSKTVELIGDVLDL